MTIETLLQEARMLPQNEQLRLASLLIQQAQSRIPADLEDGPTLQTSGKLNS